MTFHTVFNVADSLNKDKVYDRHDNVDRVSYVDSTRLIERFIMEGHNLNEVRARALNSGLYKDYEDALDSSDPITLPVYETDPAILQPIIDSAQKSLKSRAANSYDAIKRDDGVVGSDLSDRSSDGKQIDA